MTLEAYAQEFTRSDGRSEFVTFEPIELWTDVGQEIVPPGFQFSFQSIPAPARELLLLDDEIPLFILLEWHRTARKHPSGAAERAFRSELIKYQRKRQNATEGRFWRFLRDRARAEVIFLMVRTFGIIARWYIFRI